MKAGLVRLTPIDLVLFALSTRCIEHTVTSFINHESIPWWQWLFFLISGSFFKVIFDAVWKSNLDE